MTRIVADVGGTNCRLALSFADGTIGASRRFANDDYASFDALVEAFLTQEGHPEAREMVVAIAGPVAGQSGRLTNRDWHFDSKALSTRFSLRAYLMNDLGALGHALPHLPDASLLHVAEAVGSKLKSSAPQQALVVGIGTGFNVSPVLITDQGASPLGAEAGHVSLPLEVFQTLQAHLPESAAAFPTVEDCFSGRGFAALYELLQPSTPALNGPEIMAMQDLPQVQEFLTLYGKLLARLCRDLRLAYLPAGGIYLAGTVARSLMENTTARDSFVRVYTPPDKTCPNVQAPVFCIAEDAAALRGCASVTLG